MSKTLILNKTQILTKKYQSIVGQAIQNSKLVIFPTETVYGIGANALDSTASKKIFKAKGRPSDNPLIVHINDINNLAVLTKSQSLAAQKLIKHFWPGPLTLIFKKTRLVPKTTTGGLNTVAIRYPSNKIAQLVIKAAATPIAAPSANISGKPSSTRFKHVLEDFNGKVDIIIDGGSSALGIESTVVDTTVEPPVILRPGFITKTMIERALGYSVVDKSSQTFQRKVKSPGLKYKHYQPNGKLFIIEGKIDKIAQFIDKKQKTSTAKIAVICQKEYKNKFNSRVRVIGSLKKQEQIAKNLFAALRDMDDWGIELIYLPKLGNSELEQAMMNRLYKAARYRVIKVK
jgi:L-threonylcarbamoyladenylate synthase